MADSNNNFIDAIIANAQNASTGDVILGAFTLMGLTAGVILLLPKKKKKANGQRLVKNINMEYIEQLEAAIKPKYIQVMKENNFHLSPTEEYALIAQFRKVGDFQYNVAKYRDFLKRLHTDLDNGADIAKAITLSKSDPYQDLTTTLQDKMLMRSKEILSG